MTAVASKKHRLTPNPSHFLGPMRRSSSERTLLVIIASSAAIGSQKNSAVFPFEDIIQDMFTFLKRVDLEEHMDRWYMVFVQASLLDPVAVICAWGNRRNSYQQLRVLPAASREEALQTAQGIVQQKLGRGYEIVSEIDDDDYSRPSSRRISRKV